MGEYTFVISYWSEASLAITIRRGGGYLEAEARHPKCDDYGGLSLGGSWFFFSGPDWENNRIFFRVDPLDGEGIRDLLDDIAETMWEGSEFHFDEVGGDAEYWFRQHLYTAFAFGFFGQHLAQTRIPVVASDGGEPCLATEDAPQRPKDLS